MTVAINNASIRLQVIAPAPATFVHVGTARALFHCGAGLINLKAADKDFPLGQSKIKGRPIKFDGQVKLSGDPQSADDNNAVFDRWKFGFLQVSNTMVEEAIYAGRMANEGSMVANKKLGYVPNPSLDAGEDIPFTGTDQDVKITKGTDVRTAFQVRCIDGDHPNYMLPLTRENKRANAPNFLFSSRRDEGFTTVFTAFDPSGTPHFLAHFTWHIIWHCEFRWKTGIDVPTKLPITLKFNIGPVVLGPPTDAPSLVVCRNPVRPTSNDLDEKMEIAIWEQRKEPFLMQSAQRASNIGADFFT